MTKLCLRLLSNLVYKCEDSQNQFRECGGLAAVLSRCGTDFNNPFAREWALFCIRNACENNQHSLEFIHSLKPQEILQDEALQSQGITVSIDPQNGKFSFTINEDLAKSDK
jgi:ataxin-10